MADWRLSKAAADDIAAIFIHGATQFGVGQAEKYHADLARIFNFLAAHPLAAPLRAEINPPVRIHPFEAHIIVYEVDTQNNVYILRVRHGRENWTSSD